MDPQFGRDGRNHSSPSRYPCFYAPNNPEVVVARFDLARTQYIFLMFFVVPASLLVVSCGVLLLCSRHGPTLADPLANSLTPRQIFFKQCGSERAEL